MRQLRHEAEFAHLANVTVVDPGHFKPSQNAVSNPIFVTRFLGMAMRRDIATMTILVLATGAVKIALMVAIVTTTTYKGHYGALT